MSILGVLLRAVDTFRRKPTELLKVDDRLQRRLCELKLDIHMYLIPQSWHLYGFSPVCFLECAIRLHFCVKTFSHPFTSQ